jgi:hypothetical protein
MTGLTRKTWLFFLEHTATYTHLAPESSEEEEEEEEEEEVEEKEEKEGDAIRAWPCSSRCECPNIEYCPLLHQSWELVDRSRLFGNPILF